MKTIYNHHDALAELETSRPVGMRLQSLHQAIQVKYPSIARVAVALYDSATNTVKTYVHSSGADNPLPHYESGLDDAPSLLKTLTDRRPRVVNDLAVFAEGSHLHTQKIWAQGYRSSYTLPVFKKNRPIALIFFNARVPHYFDDPALSELDVYGHLIGEMVYSEKSRFQVLLAALRTANKLVHQRDPETGKHLERMAHYSRLIAQELGRRGSYALSDEMVEHIFEFAPMHDVGKIGIPDSVLRKTGSLNSDELALMRTHATLGRRLVDMILENFGFEAIEHADVLRAIAEYHHETLDGAGYPNGLRGEAIPISARIVAVADIFDGLTSRRAYKPAWTNDEAFAYLHGLAGTKLDRDCVEGLEANRGAVERIQKIFKDKVPGNALAGNDPAVREQSLH